jgi:ATP-binding cassette subfamily G (WHITE) protein 2 (PDR)
MTAPSHSQEKHTSHAIGALKSNLAFRNLSCSASSSTHGQSTFVSGALALPRALARRLGRPASSAATGLVLDRVDGIVLPGEMLLVLGASSAASSSLLKVLGGAPHGTRLGQDSIVRYSGIPYREMHGSFQGACVYLDELDAHFPELTLGQTLGFASSSMAPGGSAGAGEQTRADEVVAAFRLEKAVNTMMGNVMIRGVSGGEKRRTTIAEAWMIHAPFQFWDNSLRGLDSSTALHVLELLRQSTSSLRSTLVMTVPQASDSMFKVCRLIRRRTTAVLTRVGL